MPGQLRNPTRIPPVISLAGGVCSGKTTTAQSLAGRYGCFIVPEYMALLSPAERETFAAAPPAVRLEILNGVDEERNATISSLGPAPVVLDRCALCIFAFEYAMANWDAGYLITYAVERLLHWNRLVPSTVFFLYASRSERRRRCLSAVGKIPDFFLNDDFNGWLSEFFEKLRHLVDIHFIDTTGLHPDNVADRIRSTQLTNRVASDDDARAEIAKLLCK